MAVNLIKGGRISLNKEAPGLKKILIGLGWDTNASDTGADFDLDASVFLLDSNAKVANEKDFVFYNWLYIQLWFLLFWVWGLCILCLNL